MLAFWGIVTVNSEALSNAVPVYFIRVSLALGHFGKIDSLSLSLSKNRKSSEIFILLFFPVNVQYKEALLYFYVYLIFSCLSTV